jgi:hypothetical protein
MQLIMLQPDQAPVGQHAEGILQLLAQDPESRFEEVVDEEEAGGPDAGHGSLSM